MYCCLRLRERAADSRFFTLRFCRRVSLSSDGSVPFRLRSMRFARASFALRVLASLALSPDLGTKGASSPSPSSASLPSMDDAQSPESSLRTRAVEPVARRDARPVSAACAAAAAAAASAARQPWLWE